MTTLDLAPGEAVIIEGKVIAAVVAVTGVSVKLVVTAEPEIEQRLEVWEEVESTGGAK